MSDTDVFEARSLGRDATHRTRNWDTHLTHGCIQLFRHFSRVRFDYTVCSLLQISSFPRVFASALRTRAGVAR